MSFCLQVAGDGDVFPMLAIYAPYVRDTAITFEYEVPTAAEFGARLHHVLPEYPWLVCRAPGQVLGYAYAHRHMERAAYGWNVECSVYVLGSARGRGVGRACTGPCWNCCACRAWSTPMAASRCPTSLAKPCTGRRAFPCWGISRPRAGSRAAGTTSSGTAAACGSRVRESLRRCVLSAVSVRNWWTRCCAATPGDDFQARTVIGQSGADLAGVGLLRLEERLGGRTAVPEASRTVPPGTSATSMIRYYARGRMCWTSGLFLCVPAGRRGRCSCHQNSQTRRAWPADALPGHPRNLRAPGPHGGNCERDPTASLP